MLENSKDKKFGIHYSRYCASWNNFGDGKHCLITDWLEWLGLENEDIRNISNMYMTGKLELENGIGDFLKQARIEHPDEFED